MLHLNTYFTPGRSQENVQELSLALLKSQDVEIKSSNLQVRWKISIHDELGGTELWICWTSTGLQKCKNPSKGPLSFPARVGTKAAELLLVFWGGTGGKEHLSAQVENEPFCQWIGGEYFTGATEFVHCLGKVLFRQDLGFIFFYPSKEKAPAMEIHISLLQASGRSGTTADPDPQQRTKPCSVLYGLMSPSAILECG